MQNVAQLFDHLVAVRQPPVVAEQCVQQRLLFIGGSFPGAQEQPSRASTQRTKVRTCAKERFPAQFIEGFQRTFHDVERVVDDRGVPECLVGVDRVGEGDVHVQREELDRGLFCNAERVDPSIERGLGSPLSDPDRLASIEIADDGDELALSKIAASKVFLVDADHRERNRFACSQPALQRVDFCTPHTVPADAELHSDMGRGHRLCLKRHVLLQTSGLPL